MNVYLFRQYYTSHTFGILVAGVEVFHTLERPWLSNRSNVSCIPAGEYACKYLPKSTSGKYRKVWWLQDVEDRSGILIHNGNLVDHTKGCILVGERKGILGGKAAVLASRTAMRKLLDVIGEQGFSLKIF